MNFNRIVCFDLEMCCWDKSIRKTTGEIIEIGLAEIDLIENAIVKRAQYYVKPDTDEISEYCSNLTGITPNIINKKGRPLEHVLKSVMKNFSTKQKVFAAWGYDDVVLRNECKKKNLQYPIREYINLATLFKINKRISNGRIGQRAAMEQLDIQWQGTQHSGYVDAYNLALLAKKIL